MKRLLSAVLVLLVLSACGFHLRGISDNSPFVFGTLYVQAPAGGLGDELKRQLSLQPTLKAADADKAEATLVLEKEILDPPQILTVNSSGKVAEYQLIMRARFKLVAGHADVIPESQITLKRSYSFNPLNPLGSDQQQALLVQDMRVDATQHIIHRLAALKSLAPAATSADSAAPAANPAAAAVAK